MEQPTSRAKILGGGAMVAKLRRMAYQVYEKNFDQQELTLVAVGQKGMAMSKLLVSILREISTFHVHLLHLQPKEGNKTFDFEERGASELLRGRNVLIIDDVLYSGQTMFKAVAATMFHEPKRIEVAVLIDRGHRSVPVSPNYVGMILATSLLQYVAVEFDDDQSKASVYLY